MNVKHTPGPWKADPNNWKNIIAKAPHSVEGDGDGIALICRVAPLTYKGQDHYNKALILAAPDLREALKSLLMWAEDTRRQAIRRMGWSEYAPEPPQMQAARAAIAKAKEET